MDKKKSAVIIISVNVSIMLMQALVMLKIIPHEWINGGKVDEFEKAFVVSIVSIMIFSVMSIVLYFKWIRNKHLSASPLRITRYSLLFFYGISFILQLLGTAFELYIMSVVCLIPCITLIMMGRNRK